MRWGTVQYAPGKRPLLPGSRRTAGTALLAACVATVLAAFLAGRGSPGRLDTAIDPRIAAGLSRFPALLNWLPDLGTLRPVALMTLALVFACLATRRWSGAVLAAVAVRLAGGALAVAVPAGTGLRVLEPGLPLRRRGVLPGLR